MPGKIKKEKKRPSPISGEKRKEKKNLRMVLSVDLALSQARIKKSHLYILRGFRKLATTVGFS